MFLPSWTQASPTATPSSLSQFHTRRKGTCKGMSLPSHHSPSERKTRTENEAEAMEKYYLLVCPSRLDWLLAYIIPANMPRLGTIHSRLGPPNIKHKWRSCLRDLHIGQSYRCIVSIKILTSQNYLRLCQMTKTSHHTHHDSLETMNQNNPFSLLSLDLAMRKQITIPPQNMVFGDFHPIIFIL